MPALNEDTVIVDQYGKLHILVERVFILNDVGAGGKVIDSEYGASHFFYSTTSGDAATLTSDGVFVGKNGSRQMVLKKVD